MNVSNGRADEDELMKPFEDSEAFTRLTQDRNIYEHAKHKRTESLPEVDSSIVSQME